ncbi:MAG: alpha/beta hydrolase [Pseudomonadota bacterium]
MLLAWEHHQANDVAEIAMKIEYLELGANRRIAFERNPGKAPEIMFLGGFRSDMSGTKAEHLAEYCKRHGYAYTRFDYRGHGASSAAFEDGCIGDWADDAVQVFDQVTQGPAILIGSSMGGWMMLLVARQRLARIKGLIGIAAAPDFTEELIFADFDERQKQTLQDEGIVYLPSQYGEPDPITRRLIEDGRNHLLLRSPIAIDCPVHLLQGQEDPDVPWRTALRLGERLTGRDVTIELIKDGDHRLSRDPDLGRLSDTLDRMIARTG